MLSVSKNKVRSANFDRGFGTESIGVLARYYAAGVAALGRYRFPTTELFSEAGLTEQTLQDLNQIWIDCADFIISCDNRRQRLSAFSRLISCRALFARDTQFDTRQTPRCSNCHPIRVRGTSMRIFVTSRTRQN